MALVTLTDLYANLNSWPGNLLAASDGVSIGAHSGTAFSYTYLPGTNFAGYTVTAAGSGFTYVGNTPTDGVMKSLTITDATGHTVISVTGIVATSLASDLSLFASYQFGWTQPDGYVVKAQPSNAWSMLLAGSDTINGTAGDDRQGLMGADAGNDVFNMGSGHDRVNGGLGNDTINGGDGYDTLTYDRTQWSEGISMVRGITVNVAAGTVLDPYGFTDHFTGIEAIGGSFARDVFVGGATEVEFSGGRGADKITGGTDGDYAVYSDDRWGGGGLGIIAKLGVSISGVNVLGTIRDGFGNLDHTVNIFNVAGTIYADSFTGSAKNDTFSGGEGKDVYFGGAGFDTVDFKWTFGDTAQHGVSVNMSKAAGQIIDDGFGNIENAYSIERISASNFNDFIIGRITADDFVGRAGNDTMTGGGGNDRFEWRHLSEIGGHDVITDFFSGAGANQDVLRFNVVEFGGTSTLHLVNGSAASAAVDTFTYNVATHMLSWDPDGTGSKAAIGIVELTGVAALTAANFDLT